MSCKVTESEAGRWTYYLYFRWPSGKQFGPERREIPVPGLTKRKAEAWVEERKNRLLAAGQEAFEKRKLEYEKAVTAAQDLTFKSFAPRWVKEVLLVEDYSDGTRDEYQRLLTADVFPLFENMRVTDIRRDHLQRMKGDYLSEDYSRSTINNVLSIISGILKYSVECELRPGMPCTITQLKKEEYDDVEMQRCSDEQYGKLIEAAAALGPRYLVVVLLGGDAGLRLGEMVALEWGDIDLNTQTLNVRRQERRGKVGPTKGKKSRALKMTPRLARALKALKLARNTVEKRVLARDCNYRWDRNLERVKDRTVKNWMELIQKRAGLDPDGRVHILRHTFCSRLADAGAPPRAIQKLAGHQSFSTTEKYLHDTDELKDKAIALLGGA